MLSHKLAMSTILAIATAAVSQPAAFSQPFSVPTHPTSELNTVPAKQTQTVQPQATPVPMAEGQSLPVESSRGQTFFSHPPSLGRVAASQSGKSISSTYEFTLTVPADAGQPLEAVRITQATNVEAIKFDVSKTKAFAGGRFAAGPAIPLASIGGLQPENPGEVMVVFARPVPPGSTVTVAIAAKANPNFGGVYEFGVTAYPEGENGHGQFLGYGRINFILN